MNNYKAMYDHAIKIGQLCAKMNNEYDYDYLCTIEIDDDEIMLTGTNSYGEQVGYSYPIHYLDMSIEAIINEETAKIAEKIALAEAEEADRANDAKNTRRGLYIKLNKEFRNEKFPDLGNIFVNITSKDE